jgi:hypothetical protein
VALKPNTMLCPECKGRGIIPDRSVGLVLRAERKRARFGLRDVARELTISAPYLHDLEHGRRAWTQELIDRYRQIISQ